MMPPAGLLDGLAAVMLAVAAVSAARVIAARPWRRGAPAVDTDVANLFMAVAMSGMLAVSMRLAPAVAWEPALSVLMAWFAYRAVRVARSDGLRALPGAPCAACVLHCAAMLYMFLAVAAPAQPARYPALGFAFALALAGYCLRDLGRLAGEPPAWVAGGCRIATGVTMAFMLIVMA